MKTKHSLHSPYVYAWYTSISSKHHARTKHREDRLFLSKNWGTKILEYNGTRPKKIDSILANEVLPPAWLSMLVQTGTFIGAKKILELGTSIGITTSSLATIPTAALVVTFEKDPNLVEISKDLFLSRASGSIVKVCSGDINSTLLPYLAAMDGEPLDLVFVDANHQKAPTLEYVKVLEPYLNSVSWVILDDINHSQEMQDAWKQLRTLNTFDATIDLYRFGILIKNPNLQKTHYTLFPPGVF
jgi:predicted O-methyltransferase YrrM